MQARHTPQPITRNTFTLSDSTNRLQSRWLMADFEAGDRVVHSLYMIYASTTNTRVTMHLSTDIRYQLVCDEIDPHWTTHWSPDDKL